MGEFDQYKRELIRAAGQDPVEFQDAVELLKRNPVLNAVMSAPENFTGVFHAQGSGGIVTIGAATFQELANWADERTRQTADLSHLVEESVTDYYTFEAVKTLAAIDLGRPGLPNNDLRNWTSQLLRPGIERPKRPKRGKRPHLAWRDTLVTLLYADAFILGFPEFKNTKAKPGREKKACCHVVIEAIGGVAVIAEDTVEKIWKDNRSRIQWPLPEFPENEF